MSYRESAPTVRLWNNFFDLLMNVEALAVNKRDPILMEFCALAWKRLPPCEDEKAVIKWACLVANIETIARYLYGVSSH